MTSCTFKQGQWNCGSYQFNLFKYDIDQGDLCDVHYWQDQAQKARADEREACANVCVQQDTTQYPRTIEDEYFSTAVAVCADAIRARGNT